MAGVAVALAWWGALSVTGAFDDDTEGTAPVLTLVYGVPFYTALWAAAVGAGYAARQLWGWNRARSR